MLGDQNESANAAAYIPSGNRNRPPLPLPQLTKQPRTVAVRLLAPQPTQPNGTATPGNKKQKRTEAVLESPPEGHGCDTPKERYSGHSTEACHSD